MEFPMEDEVLIVTVDITSSYNDGVDTKHVLVSQSYPADTTWHDILSQCIRSLNSYGFIIKNQTISVDRDGYVD
jgi:hypothetical protein